jgi:hypothetical protein
MPNPVRVEKLRYLNQSIEIFDDHSRMFALTRHNLAPSRIRPDELER